MKNKIVLIKDILKIIISILIIITITKSCSHANTLTKSEAFEICRDLCGASYLFDTPSVNPGNSSWKSYNDYLDYLDTRTERVMIVYKSNNTDFTSTSSSPYIDFYDNIDTSSGYQCITTTARRGDIKSVNQSQQSLNFYKVGQGNSKSVGTSTFTPPTGDYKFYMIYYDGNIIAASFEIPPTFNFIPQNIYQTNGTPQLNVNKFDYKSKRVKLGEIESADYYLIDIKLKDENGIIIGSDGTLSNQLNYYSVEWESNALYRNQLHFYANTIYLNYERPYLLSIDVYEDRNTVHNYEYYYIFYPVNAVIENGNVVSAGSGDFNNQDNALAITEAISGLEEFWNNSFTLGSGDIEEILTNVRSKLELNGEEISGELMIIEYLKAQPRRF